MKLSITYLDGDAPIQALGYIDGYPFYFRARGDRWEFAVGNVREKSHERAIAATAQHGFGLVVSRRRSDVPRIGRNAARAIIRRCAQAYAALVEADEESEAAEVSHAQAPH